MVGPSADGGFFFMHGLEFSPDLSLSSSNNGIAIRERERQRETGKSNDYVLGPDKTERDVRYTPYARLERGEERPPGSGVN